MAGLLKLKGDRGRYVAIPRLSTSCWRREQALMPQMAKIGTHFSIFCWEKWVDGVELGCEEESARTKHQTALQ